MIRSRKGSAMLGAMIACIVIGVFATLLLEWVRIYTFKENIDRELSRAVNISIDMCMNDISRGYHSSKIDPGNAETEFYNYIQDEMNLDSDFESNNGEYKLIVEKLDIQPEPPAIEVKGYVELKPGYFSALPDINVPVSAKSRNRRMDD